MKTSISNTTNLIVSIFFIAGAAVNSGGTYYYFAIPFMVYLIYAGYKYKKTYALIAIVYSLCAIFISTTRDLNPFIYPILNGEVKILIDDGILIQDYSNAKKVITRDEFLEEYDVENGPQDLKDFLNNPNLTEGEFSYAYNSSQKTLFTHKIRKVKKGDLFKTIGIEHYYIETFDGINVITDYGKFSDYYLYTSNRFASTKEIQSGWSEKLEYFYSLIMFPINYIIVYFLVYLWSRRSKVTNFV